MSWRQAVAEAAKAVQAASRIVAERCAELGIPAEFAPSLTGPGWYGRGSNAVGRRRVELRKMARSRIEAASRHALATIEAASLRAQEQFLADGVTTEAARAFLGAMPEPTELMPPVILEVNAVLLGTGRGARS